MNFYVKPKQFCQFTLVGQGEIDTIFLPTYLKNIFAKKGVFLRVKTSFFVLLLMFLLEERLSLKKGIFFVFLQRKTSTLCVTMYIPLRSGG